MTPETLIKETTNELRDIQHELRELSYRARTAVRGCGDRAIEARATSYWITQLANLVGDDGCNPYDTTIETTIRELNGEES